jgi:malonyl CoA-acyl carrier protein transacylase
METTMLAYLFPGQGSQKVGMGKGLFDEVPEYGFLEREIDALLGYSVRKLCLENPGNNLKDTRYTQPALYVVNALSYYSAIRSGIKPNFLAGHSLGEYNALLAADAFDFLTGLRLVKKRGELMAQAKNGGMAAVIGLTESRVFQILDEHGLKSIDVANLNSPSQIVISGPVDDIRAAGPVFEKSGATMYVPLQVSAAFHSRYVSDAAQAFGQYIEPMRFSAPVIPVISNVTAAPYPMVAPGEAIKTLLVQQITRTVQWTQSMRFLVSKSVATFKEIGPGDVLTRLHRQMQQ